MTAPDVDPAGGGTDEAGASASPSLLERLRAQEPSAWQRLTALYGPTVYGWCRQAGLSPEDAADVGQDVFGAVFGSIEVFRRDHPGASFRGWLWTITRNKSLDRLRDERRQPHAEGGTTGQEKMQQVPQVEPAEDGPGPGPDKGDLLRRALELIQTEFEERTWRAFWRVTVDGSPRADVAAELGMSLGAVYTAKSRVLRRLREEFADLI
jgi:RNA polymerase sigma-70 factor (ECF subfamily)